MKYRIRQKRWLNVKKNIIWKAVFDVTTQTYCCMAYLYNTYNRILVGKKLEYDKNKSGIDKEKWFVNVYEARCSRNNGVCKTSLKHEFCFTKI